MNAIVLSISGKKHYLNENGTVLTDASTSSTDSWTSAAAVEADKNTLAYTLNGVPQKRLHVRYSFTADNQLVASFFKKENPALDEDSINVLAGGIGTDAGLNIVYTLIDQTGRNKSSLTVFGIPALINPFVLKIELAGGGEARIVANAKKDIPLEWDKNRGDVESTADDLLRFKATTKNNLQKVGGSGFKFMASKLNYAGMWGMDKDGLFFNIEAASGTPVKLQLQGSYKAVSGGLVFEYENGKAKCALAIEGHHKFEQGSATWQLCIGHSQEARKTYTSLKLDGEMTQSMGNGKELTLTGSLRYDNGTASGPKVALEIKATYEFSGGACLVKAYYEMNGVRRSYGLQLSGQVQYRSGGLTYNLSYGSDKKMSFDVLYSGTANDFENFFNMKVSVDSKGKVSCDYSFHITFVFENGVLLPPIAEKN